MRCFQTGCLLTSCLGRRLPDCWWESAGQILFRRGPIQDLAVFAPLSSWIPSILKKKSLWQQRLKELLTQEFWLLLCKKNSSNTSNFLIVLNFFWSLTLKGKRGYIYKYAFFLHISQIEILRLKRFNSQEDHPASLWGSWQMNKALLIY